MDKQTAPKPSPYWLRKLICTFYHCPKQIVCLLFGNEHKPHHRVITGIVIIVLGTMVASIECRGVFRMLCEAGGFFIHGMGSIPIIEHIARIANSAGAATVSAVESAPEAIGEALEEVQETIS